MIAAGCVLGARSGMKTAEDYIARDSLVAQWDGIENAGLGLAHDPDATVWKDLVGDHDFTIDTTKGVFTENALDCLSGKNGYVALAESGCESCVTLEIVLDRRGGSLPFSAGVDNKAVCFWQNNIQGRSDNNFGGNWSKTNTATFAFEYSNSRPASH